MAASTLLQLLEVALFGAILLLGVLTRSGPVALLGGGFLVGIAVLNILAPEGGSIYRRSWIAYTLAGLFVLGGVVLYHFAG